MKKNIYISPCMKIVSLRPEPLMDGTDDGGLIETSIPEDEPSEEAANETLFEEEDLHWAHKNVWE